MKAALVRSSCLALVSFCALACGKTTAPEPEAHSAQPETKPAQVEVAKLSDKISRPAVAHLVAIGDLHGDVDHAKKALRLAGAIDEKDTWVGGTMTVVQTGDEIDRGDGDKAILDLIESLKEQAKKAGGEVIALLGNHEIMNAQSDFRYVTAGSFSAFASFAPSMLAASDAAALDPSIAKLPSNARGRAVAFSPGGKYAQMLSQRPLFVKVGDTVFVHGGILPKHVTYGLDKMNDEVSAWLASTTKSAPDSITAEDSPVWTRAYSTDDAPADCEKLQKVLDRLGAKRMVVGHTVQKGDVTNACDGKVFRIDVGMSSFFGGPIEALAIDGDKVGIKRE
ncbi:MAG TPA: shewanella-like protein phosphatase [Polyangiaceae bacterium]